MVSDTTGIRLNNLKILPADSIPFCKFGANAKALAIDTVPIIRACETLKLKKLNFKLSK